MSKGSKRRPTDERKYGDAWDRIFANTIQACPDCHEEISQAVVGDESLDYCEWCERITEGSTITITKGST
jgi:formamidopyrimidine-DNA glycosylase